MSAQRSEAPDNPPNVAKPQHLLPADRPDNSGHPRTLQNCPPVVREALEIGGADNFGHFENHEKPQQMLAPDNPDISGHFADMTPKGRGGHGHPPLGGVPCPATKGHSSAVRQPDPDCFDPEMWR